MVHPLLRRTVWVLGRAQSKPPPHPETTQHQSSLSHNKENPFLQDSGGEGPPIKENLTTAEQPPRVSQQASGTWHTAVNTEAPLNVVPVH